jgi:hypothetical protein
MNSFGANSLISALSANCLKKSATVFLPFLDPEKVGFRSRVQSIENRLQKATAGSEYRLRRISHILLYRLGVLGFAHIRLRSRRKSAAVSDPGLVP